MWMTRYRKRAKPVIPMTIFWPTEVEKTPGRCDINSEVYISDAMRVVTRGGRRPCDTITSPYLMKIHEYQAKAILARHGVPVPRGEVTFNAADAPAIAARLGTNVVVVKAQIHAGGRGQGGRRKHAKSPEEGGKRAGEHRR